MLTNLRSQFEYLRYLDVTKFEEIRNFRNVL